jgi:outer membrane receptor protein involved in Fe transport
LTTFLLTCAQRSTNDRESNRHAVKKEADCAQWPERAAASGILGASPQNRSPRHHRMNQTPSSLLRAGLWLALAGSFFGSLRAQSTTPATPPPSEPITVLEKFTVSDVPVENQILPTVRPINSVMGDDRSIIDIPRSVSSVNKAWMDDRMVKNSMDFMQFAPGVYSAADYGIPGVPQIRGDLGQIAVNGQLIPFSRNSVPLSFNNVEAMDIVKGPGSAVYGPQGEGAGGYVNFVTKQPYFDHQHVDISTTFGYWTSGHSNSNPEFTLDFGGPLSDKLAYRVSYLERFGDDYYLNVKNETQDLYAALTYIPTKTLKFEWWAQMYSDRTNEITGANRVTQQFIDNGTYVSGPASPATSGPFAYFGYAIVTTPNLAPGSVFGSEPDGSFVVIDQATAKNVKLPAYDALVGPQDTARAKQFQTQLKTTADLSDGSKLVNLAYFALSQSDKFETYGYDEYVPRAVSIQDRLEYHDTFKTGSIEHNLITGGDFRYTQVIAYDDYTTEPFGYYDISQPLSQVYYPGYALENNTWGGGLQVPGHPGFSSGTEMQDTHIYDSAAFLQDDIKLNSKWSTTLGYRVDYIKADTANPPLIQAGLSGPFADYEGYYPITPSVFLPKGSIYKNSGKKLDQSFFTSLLYKLTETQSFYFTYDHVNAILGSSNFGGVRVSIFNSGSLNKQMGDSLGTKGTLYETGYKGSFLHNTLYFGAALFQQIKVGAQLGGPNYTIKDNGLELDSVYQPTKALSVNANATFQDATAYGSDFFQETDNYLDLYPTTMTLDGTTGTGRGSTNYQSYSPPNGRMRAPGVPKFLANFFVDYKVTKEFGIGLGPQIIGAQHANDQGTLKIPTEYELDGYVYYKLKKWDVRLNLTNLTNRRILDPIDVSFAGNDTIFVRKPISASLTFRLHL